MAFKDITKVLYDGSIKIDYKDKAHRYYARERVNWDLPTSNPKAWGKAISTKGTTTLIGDTLEKSGLMHWAKGLALGELFGYYDFKNDEGERLQGFSKTKGTLWGKTMPKATDKEGKKEFVSIIEHADKASTRVKEKGADIGTAVHDAIEHYILAHPNNPKLTPVPNEFDIATQYMWNIKEAYPDVDSPERLEKMEEFPADAEAAKAAFDRFKIWWLTVNPVLYAAEDLLYSKEYNVCGTFDSDLGIPAAHHPRADLFPGKDIIRCTTDWKTSKASKSKSAAMPEGINYQYFVQDAIYEMIRREMKLIPNDDLLVVSARKDGGFSLIYASELGLTVEECIDWAKATIVCYRMMEKIKAGLLDHAPKEAK